MPKLAETDTAYNHVERPDGGFTLFISGFASKLREIDNRYLIPINI